MEIFKCYGCRHRIEGKITLYRSSRNGVISLWHPECWLKAANVAGGDLPMGTYYLGDGMRLMPVKGPKNG